MEVQQDRTVLDQLIKAPVCGILAQFSAAASLRQRVSHLGNENARRQQVQPLVVIKILQEKRLLLAVLWQKPLHHHAGIHYERGWIFNVRVPGPPGLIRCCHPYRVAI